MRIKQKMKKPLQAKKKKFLYNPHWGENERIYFIDYLNHKWELEIDVSSTGTVAYLFKINSNFSNKLFQNRQMLRIYL